MMFLGAADVATCLSGLDPVAEVRHAFALRAAGRTVLPMEYGLRWTTPSGARARSLGLPALLDGAEPTAGVKIINAGYANVASGLPRASGLVLLFDPETARVRCLMDAARISAVRTAAVSGLAEELLRGSRPAGRLTVVGAGPLAAAHLSVLLPRLPGLRRVDVLDLDPARARALAGRFAADPVTAGNTIEGGPVSMDAGAAGDIVVTVTTTETPYLERDDVRPGALVVNVSLDDVGHSLMLGADVLVVDDWGLVADDQHRLLGRLHREGLVTGPHDPPVDGARRVDAELADLVAGTAPGRRHDGEIVVVNPFGMAIGDLALAAAVEHRAAELGLGVALPDPDDPGW